jgi:predicted nuclease with TOPRIM domain
LSPAIQLVGACRDLEVAKRKLEEKLFEMKEKQNQMDKRWQELREKEQRLRESFIHFNNSVEVCCCFMKILYYSELKVKIIIHTSVMNYLDFHPI